MSLLVQTKYLCCTCLNLKPLYKIVMWHYCKDHMSDFKAVQVSVLL